MTREMIERLSPTEDFLNLVRLLLNLAGGLDVNERWAGWNGMTRPGRGTRDEHLGDG
jgi:hypothetical protein